MFSQKNNLSMVATPKKHKISWQSKIKAENKTQQMQFSAESFYLYSSDYKSVKKVMINCIKWTINTDMG